MCTHIYINQYYNGRVSWPTYFLFPFTSSDQIPGRSGLLSALPLVDLRKLWDSNAHNLMLAEEFPHGFADKLKFQQRNDITLSHCTFVVASRGVSGPHLGRRGKVDIEN